jgi:hypothetical protein
MKSKSKKIYVSLIKNKIIGFLLFFGLTIIVYLLSRSFTYIPIIVSFSLVCILYCIRNFSNFIYMSYLYKISELNPQDLEEESKGVYSLALLSFPIIIISGMLMGLLLQSPNYSAGYVQIFLLFSFLIILNEFFIVFRMSRIQKKTPDGGKISIKPQNPLGFVVMTALENIGAILFLIALAIRLGFPYNIFGPIIVCILGFLMGYIFYKIIQKTRHVD